MIDEEIIAVVTAHKEGKMIEYCYKAEGNGIWSNCPLSICWNFGVFNYRVKPEPHYRPFESAEEVMEAIKVHGDWVVAIANDKWRHRIISYSCQRVITGYNYDEHSDGELLSNAFKRYTFLDGTPFGKLVEE